MAGMYNEAKGLLETGIENADSAYPMGYYFIGWYSFQMDDLKNAKKYYQMAEKMKPDYCFPNRLEEILALQNAVNINPSGAKAYYYLGNFWYASRQYSDAMENWELSKNKDNTY
jgi:tetratricopeptide (TPR) repeat protein